MTTVAESRRDRNDAPGHGQAPRATAGGAWPTWTLEALAQADALTAAHVETLAAEGVLGIVAQLDRVHPEAVRTLNRLLGRAAQGGKVCWWALR